MKGRLSAWISDFGYGLLNLIFPLNCPICGSGIEEDNRRYLCLSCWRKIRLIEKPVCSKCGRHSSLDVCSSCHRKRHFFSHVRAAGIYEGVLRECIHLLKYGRKTFMVHPLGELLLEVLRNDGDLRNADLIVPVPLDSRRYRQRGFNQAYLLAQIVSKALKIPVSSHNLRRVKSVPPQTQLSRKEREENIKGVFRVRSRYRGEKVILIDDVFTTGSTVNECARVLREAGAGDIYVLTVARGE